MFPWINIFKAATSGPAVITPPKQSNADENTPLIVGGAVIVAFIFAIILITKK